VSGQVALLPTYGWINLRIAHGPPPDFHFRSQPGWDPNVQAVVEFMRRRPAAFLAQAWSELLLILGLPDRWTPARFTTDLGVFLLWPLWLAGLALLGRQALSRRPLSLTVFVLIQLAAVITFGLLAYGLRLALLAYLFVFPFAAFTLNAAVRRPKLLAGAICAAIVAGTVVPWAPTTQASGRLASINPDIALAAARLPDEVRPGQTFDLELTWRVLGDPHASYTVSIHGLLDRPNKQVFVADGPPSVLHPGHTRWDGSQPTATWRAGDVLRDVHQVAVPRDAPYGLYRLEIGLYSYRPGLTPEAGHASLPLRVEGGQPTAARTLADFGAARLVDAATSDGGVTLTWQDVQPFGQDYTVFVHALDASGRVIAQDDSQPAGAAWPTSAWRPGQVIVDRHKLVLPSTARQLEIGLYQLATGQRLELAGAAGNSYRMPVTALGAR
ncbi:MAG: hypothetical protein KGJ86_07685, partial [Chloroflexota bacterium]|nr:hypothetical protein [Chloroflexota bacterium]